MATVYDDVAPVIHEARVTAKATTSAISIHLLTARVANTIVATCSSIPRDPSRQLGCAGFHASSRLAFAFDAPRMPVIILQLA